MTAGDRRESPRENPRGMRTAWAAGWRVAVVMGLGGLLLVWFHGLTRLPIERQEAQTERQALATALPGTVTFRVLPPVGGVPPGLRFLARYQGLRSGRPIGQVYRLASLGYGGWIQLLVGVGGGRVRGLEILDASSETPGLGSRVGQEAFLRQFRHRRGPVAFGSGIDAVGGASISSRAVLRAVNAALWWGGSG